MTEIEFLSKTEMALLEEFDKGRTKEEIAEEFKLNLNQVEKMLKKAIKKRKALLGIAEETPSVSIRTIDDRLNVSQKGTMKVGSQILKYMSEGIYSSPAGSLKELISNSFDSDSPTVDLVIKEDEIIVKDEGHGMNWKDFDQDFTFISKSIKRRKKDRTEIYNRPIIGFLGIGFISVSELCDTMIIKSCKKNEDKFFIAEIDFSKFREPLTEEKDFYEVSEYKLTNYLKEDYGIKIDQSFTEIKLKNLRAGFLSILRDKHPFEQSEPTIKEILDYVTYEGIGITDLGKYWQMIWSIACMIPICYQINENIKNEVINKINEKIKSYNFTVRINGEGLFKPFKFPMIDYLTSESFSIHPIEESIETPKGILNFEGYIYSQHGMIKPKEYNGILIRIKNVAIGGIDRSFLGYPSGTNQLFRNWIFGEIYVEQGLEDALNINRNKFKITDPDYIALRNWFHSFLNKKIFKYTLKEYYQKARDKRIEKRASDHVNTLREITEKEMGSNFEFKYGAIKENIPIRIDRKKMTLTVNSEYPSYRISTKLRPIVQKTLLLFEIALEQSNGDIDDLKEKFKKGLRKWIK
jgi:hypothetical protein